MSPGSRVANEREATHGHYADSAELAQKLKKLVRENRDAWRRTAAQNEALDMILFKVARIVTGDPNHVDHWRDVAGYAELVMRELGAVEPCKPAASNKTSLHTKGASVDDTVCQCPDCRYLRR